MGSAAFNVSVSLPAVKTGLMVIIISQISLPVQPALGKPRFFPQKIPTALQTVGIAGKAAFLGGEETCLCRMHGRTSQTASSRPWGATEGFPLRRPV